MQYSQEHLKTMVYAKFGGKTECIMGNWKIENAYFLILAHVPSIPKNLFCFFNSISNKLSFSKIVKKIPLVNLMDEEVKKGPITLILKRR